MNGSCLDIDSVRFKNSIDRIRYIYYWLCGIHSLKSIRNNLFKSQPKLARHFKRKGVRFGWHHFEDIYLCDVKRVGFCQGRRTDIQKHAINLDKYTTINATYAK